MEIRKNLQQRCCIDGLRAIHGQQVGGIPKIQRPRGLPLYFDRFLHLNILLLFRDLDMLHLSPIDTIDPHRLQVLANNIQVARYLKDVFPHPYTLEDAHTFISLASRGMMGHSFALRINDEFIGVGSIQPQQDIHKISGEIGYWIAEPFWGKGYGTKAVAQLVRFAFTQTKLLRLFAGVFSNNPASMRILTKSGFTQEAVFKQAIIKYDELLDEHVFTLLKATYDRQHA
jgi:ribosomal-protein-alanine N-acetyltransferase